MQQPAFADSNGATGCHTYSEATLRADLLGHYFDCLPTMVLLLDESRRIVFRNQAFVAYARQHDLPFTDAGFFTEGLHCPYGIKSSARCAFSPDCNLCSLHKITDAAYQGSPLEQDCRFISADRETIELRFHATPASFDGVRGHVLVSAQDITLESRHRLLERLFFHDLLNTAGGLHGMAQLIYSDPECVGEFKGDLRSMTESLVNELRQHRLLLAADTEELDVLLQLVSSTALLHDVTQTYLHHPVCLDRHIIIAPSSINFNFETDLTLMHRILGNLVKNALEASVPGDTIELGAMHEPGLNLFWCHNPQFIPPAQQRHLFMRSFSTKGAGRGLGTYSVKLLTERYLGGHVTLHSTPGTGTRFELAFPGPGA
ncbi:MAG: hypothetical protein RIQ79_2076 [Verrucomicrobiota bacterium]|jgi:hypothetical protein